MKITRDAFLYFNPKGNKDKFAQCETCMMWTGPRSKTCTIHGKVKVTGDMSCSLYVHGEPMPDEAGHEMKSVTPEESALIKASVRCENCKYGNGRSCELFEKLNHAMSQAFDLDTNIHPKGCCNAWVGREVTKSDVLDDIITSLRRLT